MTRARSEGMYSHQSAGGSPTFVEVLDAFSQSANGLIERRVGLVVPRQLIVHFLNAIPHPSDLLLSRLYLLLQLADLEVQHKLELIQFLVLLFQFEYFLFFLVDGDLT